MSDNSGEMLAEIWNAMKPYIDKKERQDAALSFVRVAEDYVNLEVAREDLQGLDSSIDFALNELLGDEDIKDYNDDEG
jgi:hypothetical protein